MKHTHQKQCFFLANNIRYVDYRDVHILFRFVDDHGKVMPRKKTGLSSPYQRKVEQAIKRARYMALMPYIKL